MRLLPPEQLRGVLAHEMAHIAHRDILIQTVAGVLASATGQRQCGQICRLFADGAGLCASVLTLYFFMVFLSTLLLLITGSGG